MNSLVQTSEPRWSLEAGDCREVLRGLYACDELFDACITDPPYDLTSVVKRFGGENAAPAQHGTDGLFARQSRGFMGKTWDGTGIAFEPETWRAVWDVLKPGAHLLAFGGTRTFHRMAVAIEDAGFEIRDTMMWMYGTGFPKSHDVSKGIDKAAGAVREVLSERRTGWSGTLGGKGALGGLGDAEDVRQVTAPATPEAAEWSGWGTALKPAWEPIIVARKPLIGTVAANVLAHGTGALNIDACRVGTDVVGWGGGAAVGVTWDGSNCGLAKAGVARPVEGRWPANVMHDGSDEVEAAFAAYGGRGAAAPASGATRTGKHTGRNALGVTNGTDAPAPFYGDSGTAARFFYSAKAGKADRAGSKHPTVKPIALMRYLCRLVTPPGGTVLDPFGGSGSTLQGAAEEGFSAVTIEREAEYQADIRRRIAALTDMLS